MRIQKSFFNVFLLATFRFWGKMLGVLFIFFSPLFFAIGGNDSGNPAADDENPVIEKDSVKVTQKEAQVTVYVTEGTTVIMNDGSNLNIVKVEVPLAKAQKKNIVSAPKKSHLVQARDEKILKKIPEKKYVNRYHFSGHIPSEINFSGSSRTKTAVLSSSNNKIENGHFLLPFFTFKPIVTDTDSGIFLYTEFVFSNYQLSQNFARPPPVKV